MLKELLALLEPNYPQIARSMRRVPRERFLPADYRRLARVDDALPIECGQTISQPSLVAYMTRQLDLQPGDRVLEIGTGSGYQAAVLAALGGLDVYTVEIIPHLAAQAAARLPALGFGDVHCRQGDGYFGWPEHAPYDAIIITAAAERVPPPLFEQLADGGRLVAPLGPSDDCQMLCKFVRRAGAIQSVELVPVAFVPLTRERTW